MHKKRIAINSKDRGTGTSSDFSVLIQTINNVKSVSVHSVELVNSFYNINKYNNTFQIALVLISDGYEIPKPDSFIWDSVVSRFGTVVLNCVIPVGNYTASSLSSVLQASLIQQSIENNIIPAGFGPSTFTVSYDSNTYKYTITLSTSVTYSAVVNPKSPLGYVLGFRSLKFSTAPISDTLIDMRGAHVVYIHSNIIPVNTHTTDYKQHHILTKIQLDKPLGDTIFYSSRYENSDKWTGTDISLINISLRDHNGNVLDNNNMDWTLSLVVEHD